MNTLPEICHEASGVVGVWKPSGLPTQAPAGIPSVGAWLRMRLGAGASGRAPPPRSGRFRRHALRLHAAGGRQLLRRQFERRGIRKTYLALADATDGADALEAFGRCREEARSGPTSWRRCPTSRGEDRPGGLGHRQAGDHPRPAADPAPRWRGGRVAAGASQTGRMHQLRLQARRPWAADPRRRSLRRSAR